MGFFPASGYDSMGIVKLSGIPFIGGMFPNPDQELMKQSLQTAAGVYGGMIPQMNQSYMNLLGNVLGTYSPAQNALGQIYGGAPMGGMPMGSGADSSGAAVGIEAGFSPSATPTAPQRNPMGLLLNGEGNMLPAGWKMTGVNPGGFFGGMGGLLGDVFGGIGGAAGGILGGLPGLGGGGGGGGGGLLGGLPILGGGGGGGGGRGGGILGGLGLGGLI